MQIALKPAAKGVGMERIFMRGKSRKHVIADGALKRIQVHSWAFWFDADEHHPGFLQLGLAGRSNTTCGMADSGR